MRKTLSFIVFLMSFAVFAQDEQLIRKEPGTQTGVAQPRATIDQYRIITIQRDTTYVDTSLTIQDEYEFNYLRHDHFGLLPFANEGQTYTTLDFGLRTVQRLPDIGFRGKHFFYLTPEDVRYYSVATPFTELYYKSVMEQGQNVDAFITLNTSESFNLSIAYKGLRSLGKYINQLSSAGNFRFTASYGDPKSRYQGNYHFLAQDATHGENGGIVRPEDFESDDPSFKNRARLEVYLRDAQSFLRGHRTFVDHSFRINKSDSSNNLRAFHQFTYEYKNFVYTQQTIPTTVTNDDGSTQTFNRFGPAYVPNRIHDQVRYNHMYNRLGAQYESTLLGNLSVFVDDFRFNYFYDKILVLDSGTIPNAINNEINSAGALYNLKKERWSLSGSLSSSIKGPQVTEANAAATFRINDRNALSFKYRTLSRLPEHTFTLFQSSYVNYNWANTFKNEKITGFEAEAQTQWLDLSARMKTIHDYLYFSDAGSGTEQRITPNQFSGTINYLSVKAQKEFRWWKLALDNTVLYQNVQQDADIINVPEFVTRNTLYFSDYFFKRALFLQTGVTFNYFTKYKADSYDPVLGDFFVQNHTEIGNFPMFDFFVNARIRQARIFLKAEHFNSAWTGNDFYSAPGYPYRDFLVRFGIVWNFFQ